MSRPRPRVSKLSIRNKIQYLVYQGPKTSIMRKLALWARSNPRRARIHIIALHLVLGILAYFLARLLQVSVFVQDLLLFCSIAYFLVLVWIYPDHRSSTRFEFLKSFAFRKVCDFSVALCSFI